MPQFDLHHPAVGQTVRKRMHCASGSVKHINRNAHRLKSGSAISFF